MPNVNNSSNPSRQSYNSLVKVLEDVLATNDKEGNILVAEKAKENEKCEIDGVERDDVVYISQQGKKHGAAALKDKLSGRRDAQYQKACAFLEDLVVRVEHEGGDSTKHAVTAIKLALSVSKKKRRIDMNYLRPEFQIILADAKTKTEISVEKALAGSKEGEVSALIFDVGMAQVDPAGPRATQVRQRQDERGTQFRNIEDVNQKARDVLKRCPSETTDKLTLRRPSFTSPPADGSPAEASQSLVRHLAGWPGFDLQEKVRAFEKSAATLDDAEFKQASRDLLLELAKQKSLLDLLKTTINREFLETVRAEDRRRLQELAQAADKVRADIQKPDSPFARLETLALAAYNDPATVRRVRDKVLGAPSTDVGTPPVKQPSAPVVQPQVGPLRPLPALPGNAAQPNAAPAGVLPQGQGPQIPIGQPQAWVGGPPPSGLPPPLVLGGQPPAGAQPAAVPPVWFGGPPPSDVIPPPQLAAQGVQPLAGPQVGLGGPPPSDVLPPPDAASLAAVPSSPDAPGGEASVEAQFQNLENQLIVQAMAAMNAKPRIYESKVEVNEGAGKVKRLDAAALDAEYTRARKEEKGQVYLAASRNDDGKGYRVLDEKGEAYYIKVKKIKNRRLDPLDVRGHRRKQIEEAGRAMRLLLNLLPGKDIKNSAAPIESWLNQPALHQYAPSDSVATAASDLLQKKAFLDKDDRDLERQSEISEVWKKSTPFDMNEVGALWSGPGQKNFYQRMLARFNHQWGNEDVRPYAAKEEVLAGRMEALVDRSVELGNLLIPIIDGEEFKSAIAPWMLEIRSDSGNVLEPKAALQNMVRYGISAYDPLFATQLQEWADPTRSDKDFADEARGLMRGLTYRIDRLKLAGGIFTDEEFLKHVPAQVASKMREVGEEMLKMAEAMLDPEGPFAGLYRMCEAAVEHPASIKAAMSQVLIAPPTDVPPPGDMPPPPRGGNMLLPPQLGAGAPPGDLPPPPTSVWLDGVAPPDDFPAPPGGQPQAMAVH